MKRPSTRYLYGLVNTFGVSVTVSQEDLDRWDAEFAAEQQAARLDQAIDGFRRRTSNAALFPKRDGGQ